MDDKPIIPQLLNLMAVVSTIFAFPIFNPFTNKEYNFLCIEYEVHGAASYGCSPLYLNNENYWSEPTRKGWAGAIQAAAVFGILAAAIGFIAFSLLATASCFVLKLRRVLAIVILDVVCAVLSILTLIAGASDVCRNIDGCTTDKARIDTGAGFMIFAFIFYLAAGGMTLWWFFELRSKQTPIKCEEKSPLVESAPPLRSPGSATTVTKTVLPDGMTRIEREYVDETGTLVKEITTEHSEEHEVLSAISR